MQRRIRLIGTTALLGGLILSAGTACGSDDPEAKTASAPPPSSVSATATPTDPASPAPPSPVPTSQAPPVTSAPQSGGLQPVVGRWDYFDKTLNKTFSISIGADGSVRSVEPGERNNAGRIEATGPRTFLIHPVGSTGAPAKVTLSADGKSLVVSAEGESVTFAKAG